MADMEQQIEMTRDAQGKLWLEKKWPNMRVADVNWTMERGEFPSYVKDYICNSGDWIKVNHENGGTYCDKVHFEQSYKKNMIARGWTPPETVQQEFNNGMDERNKAALKVLQTEGTDAAVKHMFTDDKTGGQLSYSEMRSRYG